MPRSRRPKTSPGRISDRYEDEIVALRKQLIRQAASTPGRRPIFAHLASAAMVQPPSVPTIWRVLKAIVAFVTPEPHKRPKGSYRALFAHGSAERALAGRCHPLRH